MKLIVPGVSEKRKQPQKIVFLHNKLTTNYDICKNKKIISGKLTLHTSLT